MRRNSGIRLGMSALLVAGTLAGTAAASASASSSSSSEPVASEALLTALQSDFGLTEAEAVERLAAEEAAIATEPDARQAAGSTFGGSWFDPASGDLVVAVTDDTRVSRVEATGAETTLVEHGQAALDATLASVDALADEVGAPAGVASWRVDPRVNSVVIDLVEGQESSAGVAEFVAAAEEAGPVTVGSIPEAPSTFAAGTVGGDPYYTGNVRCSIGFSVHGGFVTAGHCGPQGQAVSGWDRTHIGTFQGSSFPGNDYAWVSVGSGWWTEPVVLGWGATSDQLVRGSNEAPIGASICRSGSTTGWHCGSVMAKNETVNYSDGTQVRQMTKTSVCAEGGDSGGSYISGDQAQGVTSGGWGNCSSGGETWYQPLNEILNAYGLTLHTA
ncbi:Alpha-lytic protease prodomain-containing protein [Streptomyces zhaozhouensis]|uniref:Alpha-lytic protease prodomain-containing protein n=1 Tax=Streptomyces zhaozhouensis TaxID=1300267 RepID=A0A286DK05_9ACTN|nr:S1 family peptidase [Streptomyces zhaozhouensis]SOD58923.1 Alpha-lytic protease prodomain-containing protein [Streptomyces zhaozhouensis]